MKNITVRVTDLVLYLLKVMGSTGIGFLSVLDNFDKLVGLITDRDIRRGFSLLY